MTDNRCDWSPLERDVVTPLSIDRDALVDAVDQVKLGVPNGM